jgi:CubicO group peptidase (beta-lactamase class C family)
MEGSEEQNTRIDALMRAYQGDVPGACLLVVERGDAVLRRAYGYADLERRARASRATNYRLASMTKAFTAAAVLLLAEEGRLELAAPIGRWLPKLPAAARAVTIRQLLTHTSGRSPARSSSVLVIERLRLAEAVAQPNARQSPALGLDLPQRYEILAPKTLGSLTVSRKSKLPVLLKMIAFLFARLVT